MVAQLGRYQLHRLIGRGGMAEVWLATRRGAGGVERRVVIKRILRERVNDPRFLDLFVREAQISMSLSHKNIVPIFDFGRVGDELFLVMDYVDGPNLAMALRLARERQKPPSAILACHLVFEACQALAYAHDYKDERGSALRIAHRDVTPANLLLSFSGEVKLGDFGLAAATAGLSEGDGSTQGTPAYMAPEQAMGEMVGPLADLYSLGLILREVLIGERLRKGEHAEQLLAAKAPVPALPPDVPPALARICERGCMVEASERYQSAQAMAADLDIYLVRARAEAGGDRRPMPQQLSDWLASLFPDGLETKECEAQIQGRPRTFLEDGLHDVLDDHGDATMRSLAATVVERGARSADLLAEAVHPGASGGQADQEQARSLGWPRKLGVVGIAAALSLLVVVPTWLTGSSKTPPQASSTSSFGTSDAGQDRQASAGVALDAGAVDAGGMDASQPQQDARPIAVDARLRPVSLPKENSVVAESLSVLRVSSSPWATVRVLGRSEGCDETPCQLRLPPGSYQLLFENPIAGLKRTASITVAGDSSIHQVLEPTDRANPM